MDIFVFGSNEAGRHGAGAALCAWSRHGAQRGVGRGPTGRAYAIPTKDRFLKTRSLDEIQQDVEHFKVYANLFPERTFNVTRIGCGLAGYTNEQIAPMFANAPANCRFDPEWQPIIDQINQEK
jgi:hypothetical protein